MSRNEGATYSTRTGSARVHPLNPLKFENGATLLNDRISPFLTETCISPPSKSNDLRLGSAYGSSSKQSTKILKELGEEDFTITGAFSPTITKDNCLLHPHENIAIAWSVIGSILILYDAFATPFRLSFIGIDESIEGLENYVLDMFFTADIILNFNIGVEMQGTITMERKIIAQEYLKSWFFPDLISTLRWEVLVELFFGNVGPSKLFFLAKSMRLLRLLRFRRIANRLKYSLMISSTVSSLVGFGLIVTWTSHIFSCLFAYISFGEEHLLEAFLENKTLEDQTLTTQYLSALYWAIMTMTTVGFGDLSARSTSGRLFSICAMIIGAGIFAYGITNVVALFAFLNESNVNFHRKMDRINKYMAERNLPQKLKEEVHEYFVREKLLRGETQTLERELINNLSAGLKYSIAESLKESFLMKYPFFNGCNSVFILDLSLCVEVKCYPPGEIICNEDDFGSEMYFISTGCVEVIVKQKVVTVLGPNQYFVHAKIGERSILHPQKRRSATVRCMDYSVIHVLTTKDIFTALDNHKFVRTNIAQLAKLESKKAASILIERNSHKRRSFVECCAAHCESNVFYESPNPERETEGSKRKLRLQKIVNQRNKSRFCKVLIASSAFLKNRENNSKIARNASCKNKAQVAEENKFLREEVAEESKSLRKEVDEIKRLLVSLNNAMEVVSNEKEKHTVESKLSQLPIMNEIKPHRANVHFNSEAQLPRYY